jgi:hypothetical protein
MVGSVSDFMAVSQEKPLPGSLPIGDGQDGFEKVNVPFSI